MFIFASGKTEKYETVIDFYDVINVCHSLCAKTYRDEFMG
jgi:hypothetical protein